MSWLLRSTRLVKQRWALAIAVLTGLAVAAGGCGTSELDVDPTFDGVWDVIAVETEAEEILAVPADLTIEIDTGEAALRGRTDCRQFFGSYTLVDDGGDDGLATFTIPSPPPGDECSAEDRALHIGLVEALEAVTQWRREGSGLTLTSPAGARVALTNQVASAPGP